MLRYTGHPLYDVGVATITAFADKAHPSELNEADLKAVADYITREYTRQPLKSFLTVAFPNSGFTQPAFEQTPERRLEYARRVLRSYEATAPVLNESCVFTGEPAVAIAFGDKEGLAQGRAFRQHIPLLTGEDVINFHPNGDAGLPVSGKALLAIQAFPLGCAKVAGRLLAVHSDNDELLLHFARTFLIKNRRSVQLAQTANSSKMPEANLSQKTLLISTLLQANEMQRDAYKDEQLFSLTAYHLTNSGQGVGLDIYELPLQIIGFLGDMQLAEYHADWSVVVQRAWAIAPPLKKGAKPDPDFQPRRNYIYEDLFNLPENARAFLRTYFLRIAFRYARADQGDPRRSYSINNEISLVSWKLTARFLRRVMNMEKDRIEAIRQMGDQLADYVYSENDKRFFRNFFNLDKYDYFRIALIKANAAYVRHGKPPFITLDPYIEVFEIGSEIPYAEWKLARDLVLIRMIERLHQLGWFNKNADALPEPEDPANSDNVDSDN